MAAGLQITFDCADPKRLARFWAEAIHYEPAEPPEGYKSWEDALRAIMWAAGMRGSGSSLDLE